MTSSLYFKISLMVLTIYGVQSKMYTTLNNNTYYIDDKYLYNWYEAHLECSARDMALLTIESKEKYDDIYQLLKSGVFNDKPPHLWVGAIGIKRKFAWISNGKPIIPSMWCNICPNDYPNNENCVEFWGTEHGLNDLNCDSKCGFVCEDRIKQKSSRDGKFGNMILNFIQRN